MKEPERLEGAVRAWAVPDYAKATRSAKGGGYEDPGPSEWSLTFDTETTRDPGQALRVGGYQVRYRGRPRKEGLFYNPATISDSELSTLRAYCERHGLELLDRDGFAERIFLATIYRRRGLLIGHNLPFDLFRIAVAHEPARSRNKTLRGGFTVAISRDPRAPRVQVKRASPGAAFFQLTIPTGQHAEYRNRRRGGRAKNHHGYFLDTATLGGAMLGGRPSLEGLSKLLETPDRKSSSEEHGEVLSESYLDYLRNDVEVTRQCAAALRDRYEDLGLSKPAWKVYSEASVGKAHLEEMGIRGWNRAEFPDWLIAAILESYHGGRTECRIRRTAVPGVYVDFKSQYPTAFVLQDLWRYVTAAKIGRHEADPAEVQGKLESVDVEAVLDPATWRGLNLLVLVEPDRDRLPTRARYRKRGDSKANYNVAVALRSGGPPVWMALADCIASVLHTGKAPRVLRALRFEPLGTQSGLQPVDVGGDSHYRVDPYKDDLIRRLVELRTDVRSDRAEADRSGDANRAAQLDGMQRAMKATANSIAYGTGIEINVIEHRKLVGVSVHLPDGTSYATKADRSEQPGSYFNPLLATLITAGGRLLLASAMTLVADAGGEYAYCDTDSLFIVATEKGGLVPCRGGSETTAEGQEEIRAMSWSAVSDLTERFTSLNPYDETAISGSILEIEAENFDPETRKQREIECYAIGSKRGARFTRGKDGRPRLTGDSQSRSRSEHGLGHLLPPQARGAEASGSDWMDDWWERLLGLELGVAGEDPDWFPLPAVGRITVTSPREERAFRGYNAGRSYDEQVKPWCFMSVAHPIVTERALPSAPRCLIAPFERDAVQRLQMGWADRSDPNGGLYRIRIDDSLEIREDSIAVQSYGHYFDDYRRHPEAKLLDPDGRPCHPWSRGLLQPRHVELSEIRRIGKESNRLAETALPLELDEHGVVEYGEPLACQNCGCALGGRRRKWCSEGCRVSHRRRAPIPCGFQLGSACDSGCGSSSGH